ncbi:hypothetical protein [Haloarcula halophila]|uniref:hypothetical protein n=1 Tax=Haloarcula TaxID=2237 RepID=UPI0023E3A209|nr:hypothetical protein [Halomicroarcula sp. DFY41]
MSRSNVLAGLLCFVGVAMLVVVFGPEAISSTPGRTAFTGAIALAGLLFSLAATRRRGRLAGRPIDLHDCSALGDVAIGLATLTGLAAVPGGVAGVLYAALVVAGSLSAVAFGVVGLAEKYGLLSAT